MIKKENKKKKELCIENQKIRKMYYIEYQNRVQIQPEDSDRKRKAENNEQIRREKECQERKRTRYKR